MNEWFESESFWEKTYDFLFPEKLISETDEQAEHIVKIAGVNDASVLDLCCGPGRFSIALAKKGFSVTGVDQSSFLLSKAKDRATSEGVSVEWILEDMRHYIRPMAYDLVLNVFTSFGYFDDKRDDIKVLENVLTNLKSGGIFFIDVIGKEKLAEAFQPTTADVMDDGTIVIQRREIFDDWTRVRNEWIIIKDGQANTFEFHLTVYSGQELRDRMEQVGFESIKLYGNFDGSPYDSNAQRLIITGRKPLQ